MSSSRSSAMGIGLHENCTRLGIDEEVGGGVASDDDEMQEDWDGDGGDDEREEDGVEENNMVLEDGIDEGRDEEVQR